MGQQFGTTMAPQGRVACLLEEPSHLAAVPDPAGAAEAADSILRQEVGLVALAVLPTEMARYGVTAMLRDLPKVQQAYACANVPEAKILLDQQPVDIVILAFDACGELPLLTPSAARHNTKVLVLIDDLSDEVLATLAELTVNGFLLAAGLTLRNLGETLTRLRNDEMAVPTGLAQQMMNRFRYARTVGRPPVSLTPREHQTLQLLAKGCSNKQVASCLGVSQHGAKRYVANVLAKLNCPNRTLAVAYALRAGLIGGNG